MKQLLLLVVGKVMSLFYLLCLLLQILFLFSVWLWLIPPHSKQMYFASVALGYGSSTMLVTVLTMLADLIGNNIVRTTDVKFNLSPQPSVCLPLSRKAKYASL